MSKGDTSKIIGQWELKHRVILVFVGMPILFFHSGLHKACGYKPS
jgi:hypothetical protein